MGFVIAIDGPAASGKGTLAARLGEAFGLPVLDSGLLYRAVAKAVVGAGGALEDEEACAGAARALTLGDLSDPGLRTAAMGEAASRVAVHASVRAALIGAQRAFAAREPGAVLDGRDIGTVILPNADAKLFVTASAEARAARRWRETADRDATYEAVLADILRRDARDEGRVTAPLRRAPDAILLDTTDLSIDAAFDAARRIVEAARARSGAGTQSS
ncbi:MAG TPA: (d)CMP kinase [Caulobacteraceae bacterium]|nr:(d)CMP kinase [Caulobacteraceae bacterium]